MARVTVEDCLSNVDNRFQLVLVATKRARQLSLGAQALVEEQNDKPTVLALREIAEGHVTRDILDESIEEEILEFITEEETEEEVSEPTELDALTAALQAELAGDAAAAIAEPKAVEAEVVESSDDSADAKEATE